MEVYINAKELLAVAKFADNKKCERENLQCVMVESDEQNNYILTATDSFKMIEVNRKFVNAIGKPGKCAIPIKDIKDNIKSSDSFAHVVCEDEEYAIIEVYKGKGAKRELRTSFACKPFEVGNMYGTCKDLMRDWNSDIKQDTTCMYMDTTYLGDICNAVSAMYGKNKGIEIGFADPHKPIYFQAIETPGNYCRGILMPLRK